MPKLLHIAAKDFRIIMRDKAAFLIMLAMPLALIFILGSALGGINESTAVNIDVAIVNDDTGDAGAEFADALTGIEDLQNLFNMTVRDDAEAVRAEVERGDLTAALIIPAEFSARLAAGTPVSLEVLQDPGAEIAAGIWAGVARAGAANLSAGQVIRLSVEDALAEAGVPAGAIDGATGGQTGGHQQYTFDAVAVEDLEVATEKQIPMVDFYAAGQTAMFVLFVSMFGAFTFAKERREQTLARVLVSPTTRIQVVGGKALGIFAVALAQLLVLFLGTTFIFGVDWGPNPFGTLVVGLAEALAAVGLGMTLAALGKTERAIGGIGPTAIMLFAAVGGSMVPTQFMPAWMKPIQSISPVYWSLDAFLALMRGASFASVLPSVAVLLAIGAVLFGVGVWRLRYE